jgi:hypothetical protein
MRRILSESADLQVGLIELQRSLRAGAGEIGRSADMPTVAPGHAAIGSGAVRTRRVASDLGGRSVPRDPVVRIREEAPAYTHTSEGAAMRIFSTIAVSAVMLGAAATAVAVAHTHAESSPDSPAHPQGALSMSMPMSAASAALPAAQLARARVATARYANDLGAAKADGYSILTQRIPGMGYHFINPAVKGFDVRRPAILVYERHGSHWQLGALEWAFPKKPATPPLQGATYGSFPAACHYHDGTFVVEPNASACAATSPRSGSSFNFWHPALVTMHVWMWYPNPDGMYASMNPLVTAFS